jgi:hypothetical protein
MRKTLDYKGKNPARSKNAWWATRNTGRNVQGKRTKKSPNALFGLNPPLEEGGGDMLRCREARQPMRRIIRIGLVRRKEIYIVKDETIM